MARNSKGRPRKARTAHKITLSLDYDAWIIYSIQKNNHNMSKEYQQMLKARYDRIVPLKTKLNSWKEKLYEVQKERDGKLMLVGDIYEKELEKISIVVKRIAEDLQQLSSKNDYHASNTVKKG